jgi:hypothetical protein
MRNASLANPATRKSLPGSALGGGVKNGVIGRLGHQHRTRARGQSRHRPPQIGQQAFRHLPLRPARVTIASCAPQFALSSKGAYLPGHLPKTTWG